MVYCSENFSHKMVCPRVIDISLHGVVGLHVRVLMLQELVVTDKSLIAVCSKSNLFQGVGVECSLEIQIYLVI